MAALTTAVAPSPPTMFERRGILLRTSKFLAPAAMTSLSSLKTGALCGRTSAHARNFRVRAARTESERVSLGFRAPQFELTEPLTGKSWSLDDFEVYPALLVEVFLQQTRVDVELSWSALSWHCFLCRKGWQWLQYHQTLSGHTHRMVQTSWHRMQKHLITLSLIYMTSPKMWHTLLEPSVLPSSFYSRRMAGGHFSSCSMASLMIPGRAIMCL